MRDSAGLGICLTGFPSLDLRHPGHEGPPHSFSCRAKCITAPVIRYAFGSMTRDSVIGLNLYEVDSALEEHLRDRIDSSQWNWAEGWLSRWGELCGGPIARRAEIVDKNPPQLVRYDRWGREANQVVHHPDAIATKRDLCEAGYTGFAWSEEVISDPGRRQVAPLLSTTFNYMLCQSDTGMACACGMTGGVARILERFAPAQVKDRYLPRMTTTNFDDLWDGAMFMTERTGGSDLSRTDTSAIKDGEQWLLDGEKWFCSNIDAKAILTLARPEGSGPGTKGLALFLVPSLLEDGTPNAIHIRRIKDKLGTRSVPTGEVIFERAVAYRVAEPGAGLVRMMGMVNASRLGVAVMGAGIARRTVLEAVIHASQREAFGRLIRDYPMVRETLIDMQVEAEAVLQMCLESAALGGKLAVGSISDEEQDFLRILTPLTKIRAARVGLENAIQAVEVLGGNGYIEDWPTARQLRDAQCHTIWEGTENINSLDVLRAMAKQNAHQALLGRVDEVIEAASSEDVDILAATREEAAKAAKIVADAPDVHAKRFAHLLADLVCAALFVEHDSNSRSNRSRLVASRYLDRHLRDLGRMPESESYLTDEAFSEIVVHPA